MKSLKRYEPLLQKIRHVYIVIFVVYLLLSRIVPFVNLISQSVNAVIYGALAVSGALILAADFLMTFSVFKSTENKILLAFLLVCVISSIINIEYGITNNIKTLAWMAIQFFVLFSFVNMNEKEEMNATVTTVMKVSAAVMLAAVLISIGQFILHIGYVVDFSEYPRRQGFVDSRLFGVFTDPNYAAVTSLTVIIFCWYLFKNTENKKLRIYYVVNIVFQMLYVVLSGSRTAMIEGAMLAFIMVFFSSRNSGVFMRINHVNIKAAINGAIAAGLSVLLILAIQSSMLSISEVSESIKIKINTNYHEDTLTLERDDVKKDDISNGRLRIWKDAVEISSDHRLFGLSPRNLSSYAKANYPDSFLAVKGYEAHNGYLAVLVGSGVIGSLVIIAFIVYMLKHIVQYIIGMKKREYDNEFILLISVLFTIAVSAFLLLDIFFVNTYGTAVFWLFFGCLACRMKKEAHYE